MNKQRQRALDVALGVFAVMCVASACSIAPPAPVPDGAATAIASAPTVSAGAQTAVTGVQTAAAGAQTAAAVVQTVVPGAQSTIQSAATVAAAVITDPRLTQSVLSAMLAGATVQMDLTPPNASGSDVRQVAIRATDASGLFGRQDKGSQQASTNAALIAAGQVFPSASIALSVVDSGGASIVNGSKAPGASPSVSQ